MTEEKRRNIGERKERGVRRVDLRDTKKRSEEKGKGEEWEKG